MRVAVCQLNSRDDREANLIVARQLLEAAAARGADLAVLPEYTDHLGPNPPKPEPVDGSYGQFFAAAARELGMWVHAGSFHELGPATAFGRGAASDAPSESDRERRTYNTSLLFDRSGNLAAAYRKIHLYDVDLPGRVSYRESATVAPGEDVVTAEVEGITLGLSICYDLRFPELYRKLTDAGAEMLAVPAAFMLHTGRDHWEVLLRARAIEGQAYVVAAGQIGDHDPGRTCYGRSMLIDPWGTVLAQAPDEVGVTVADIDLSRVRRIRSELPSLANRRIFA